LRAAFWAFGLAVCFHLPAAAQEPGPETGATLFPGGGVVSYRSVFQTRKPLAPGDTITARPTLSHEGRFTFAWGFRRDFQLTVIVPVVTVRRRPFASEPETGGTGLGDARVLLKYRFLRRDSERGTTQAAFTIGPKLPTGHTGLRDASGQRLPPGVQPGTGSTDVHFNLSATYTGLFNIRRLVADSSVTYLLRTEGAQNLRQGDSVESRFWLSYRPYQTKTVGKEWFIGPLLLWHYHRPDQLAGATLANSGGTAVALGATTYFSPGPGVHLWFEAAFPVYQTRRGAQTTLDSRYSFGVTRQFRFPF
jgi:hypothetical protein